MFSSDYWQFFLKNNQDKVTIWNHLTISQSIFETLNNFWNSYTQELE